MKTIVSRAKAWAARQWVRVKAAVKSAWKAITAFIVALLASLGLWVTAQDNSVTVSWQNATEYEDGSPLPTEDIEETKIWRASYPVGQSDGSVAKTLIDSVPPTITTYVDTLGSGDFCYDLTHVATNGTESAHSDEACKTIDNRIPGAPQNLAVE